MYITAVSEFLYRLKASNWVGCSNSGDTLPLKFTSTLSDVWSRAELFCAGQRGDKQRAQVGQVWSFSTFAFAIETPPAWMSVVDGMVAAWIHARMQSDWRVLPQGKPYRLSRRDQYNIRTSSHTLPRGNKSKLQFQ